jgi:putative restriction endonuclease
MRQGASRNRTSNGLLLRSDFHKLCDSGYITGDPADHRIIVSARIRLKHESGIEYYQLHRKPLLHQSEPRTIPLDTYLEFHAYRVFR